MRYLFIDHVTEKFYYNKLNNSKTWNKKSKYKKK